MKRIKFLALLAFAAFTAVSFNACKGDDDGDDDNKDNGVVFTEKDGSQYSQSLSELKDNGSELSFTLTIKYIKPVEAKEEYAYRFVYKVENDSLPQSSDSTIVSAVMEVTCGSAEAAEALRDTMMIDDADSYDMTIDGNKLICNFKEKELEGLTYIVVKTEYYDWVEEIEDQRKKNEAEKAAEQNKTIPEETQPSTNSKNSRLDLTKDADETKNDTSAITMTYVKASAGQGVAYNYKLNEDGTFASGTVVVAFKNADDAKAYAKSESRAKDEDGDRIYKSVSIDGGNVVLTYSAKALANMTEETAKALFNEKKAEMGASTPSNPEENNGENNEEENGENNEGENENPDNQEDTPQSEE